MNNIHQTKNYNQFIFYWLLSGCLLVFLMVVVGGITRLTGSGLSITEWKPIMGAIPPLTDTDWNIAFEKYKQIPQYKKINHYFTLTDFKFIFFWEWLHRLLGRIMGVVFIIPFLYLKWKGSIDKSLNKALWLILGLGAFQGFLGWFMVSSGLSELTYVSHFRLADHLVTALIAFGFIFWTALNVYQKQTISSANHLLIKQWWLLFSLLLLQIIYGAFVAGLHAGFEINSWPLMNGKLFFTESFSEDNWFLNFINNKAGVQIVHRYIAYLILALTLWWAYKLKNENKQYRIAACWLNAMVILQFILGVITILFVNRKDFTVIIGVLHQCGAFALFTTYIYALHKIKTVR